MNPSMNFFFAVIALLNVSLLILVLWKSRGNLKIGQNALQKVFPNQEDWKKLQWGKKVPFTYQGRNFLCQYGRGGKNNSADFSMSLPGVVWPSLGVQKENAFHRFSKRIGLTAELESGDRVFDEQFFVDTADMSFYRYVLSSPSRREAIGRLLTGISPPVRQIKADKKGITLWIRPFRLKPEADFHLEPYLDSLLCLVDGLEISTAGAPHEEPEGSGFLSRTILLFVLSVAALITGVILLTLGNLWYPPLDSEFFTRGFTYSLPLLPPFWFLSYLAIRGKSWSHRLFFPLILISLVASLFLGYAGMLFTNGFWDESRPADHTCTVQGKHITKSKDSRTFYLTISSWNDPGGSYRINISGKLYEKLQAGQTLRITTRAGYWEQEWIVKIHDP